MGGPTPIAKRSHQNGRLQVTVHQFGEGGPYGCEFSTQQGPELKTTYATSDQAKAAADRAVSQEGHRCDDGCTAWRSV
jgi:hypothetical protein